MGWGGVRDGKGGEGVLRQRILKMGGCGVAPRVSTVEMGAGMHLGMGSAEVPSATT